MPFMNFLVHSYTCCSDRRASPFIDEFRWVSPFHYLKNRWQNAVLLWCMLQAGPPSLLYYCAIVLHSCIILPPVGHSSNHEYHCCQLTRESSCVSNFYRTFEVFIWLFLVLLFTIEHSPSLNLAIPTLKTYGSCNPCKIKITVNCIWQIPQPHGRGCRRDKHIGACSTHDWQEVHFWLGGKDNTGEAGNWHLIHAE